MRAWIDAAQDRSEILIGWLQLGAVIVFATLYALSPKTAPDGAGFQPAALAIAVYAIFTVLRLAIARARPTLEQALADAVAAEDMSRLLAPEVLAQVTESEARVAVGKGETREAVVLFLDIRDFT